MALTDVENYTKAIMSQMTDSIAVGSIEIRNRFFRSATNEYLANDATGASSTAMREMYLDLAEGGIGLIVTGQTYIERVGRSGRFTSGIDTNQHIAAWRDTIAPAQEAGARVFVQLNHCGAAGFSNANPNPISPSGLKILDRLSPSTAMTPDEIERVVGAFGSAAARALEAGFDGVQIHGCHGFLVTQFLTPGMNNRTDEWGGDPSKRMEFLRRVIREIRVSVGTSYPVWIKLGIGGGADMGPSVEEGLYTALMCRDEGIDCIEVAHGYGVPEGYDSKAVLWFLPILHRVREIVGAGYPIAAVDRFGDLPTMNRVLENELSQMVGMCRPLIAEPDLPQKLMDGEVEAAVCARCNRCRPKEHEVGVTCRNDSVQKKLGRNRPQRIPGRRSL